MDKRATRDRSVARKEMIRLRAVLLSDAVNLLSKDSYGL